MHEDDVDDDEMHEDEDEDRLPELRLEELSHPDDTDGTGPSRPIVIEERMIPSLADIVAIANKDHRPVSIEECELAEARIDSANIDISIDESVFTQNAAFSNGIFLGKVTFFDVMFDKKADFGKAVFRGKVYFEDCLFCDTADFSGALFEDSAAFRFCEFKGETTFEGGTFGQEADFSESTFHTKVLFKEAVFKKDVHVHNAQFKDGFEASGSNFGDTKKEVRTQKKPADKRSHKRIKPQKASFNPWRELDKASKKTMSRRDMLRGVFRFLPKEKEK